MRSSVVDVKDLDAVIVKIILYIYMENVDKYKSELNTELTKIL